MTTWARVVSNYASEVTQTDPAGRFTPNIEAQFQIVPDGTLQGATFSGGVWTNPPPPIPPPPPPVVYPTVSVPAFMLLFTSPERQAIRAKVADTATPDHVLNDWWAILQDPRTTSVDLNHASTQQALAYLVSANFIAQGRLAQILAGS